MNLENQTGDTADLNIYCNFSEVSAETETVDWLSAETETTPKFNF